MKRPLSVGLLAAGPVARTYLARLSFIRQNLGPVMSPHYRVASRICNSLGAGYPVRSFTDLAEIEALFVYLREQEIDSVLARPEFSDVDWDNKLICICESVRESTSFLDFQRQGASVVTINAVYGFFENLFLLEGDSRSVRILKPYFHAENRRTLTVSPDHKQLFLAIPVVLQATFPVLLELSVRGYRAAGLHVSQAIRLASQQAAVLCSSYERAQLRGWSGPFSARQDGQAGPILLEALRAGAPELAEFFQQVTLKWLDALGNDHNKASDLFEPFHGDAQNSA